MREYSFILLILCLLSCNENQCGNDLSVFGTYVNDSNVSDINYITLNKNGTYYYYYKRKGEKEKTFSGKWKEFLTKDECEVLFYEWKDIVGYMKLDALSTTSIIHRNNKLTFFLDLPESVYTKKEK